MAPEKLQIEEERLKARIRELQVKILLDIQRGRLLGLDRQVRQVQKQFSLMRRI